MGLRGGVRAQAEAACESKRRGCMCLSLRPLPVSGRALSRPSGAPRESTASATRTRCVRA
eukprot:1845775-Pleurochrysis_carterae.AAC.1